MSTPATADQAFMRYRFDVAQCVSTTRLRLLGACRAKPDLKPVAFLLKGDLTESIVFKKVCQWLDARKQPARAPLDIDVRRQALYQFSRELSRRNQGHLVAVLARACIPG